MKIRIRKKKIAMKRFALKVAFCSLLERLQGNALLYACHYLNCSKY